MENLPLKNFYTAEDYHQNYLDKNPDGYYHLPQSLFEFARRPRPARLPAGRPAKPRTIMQTNSNLMTVRL